MLLKKFLFSLGTLLFSTASTTLAISCGSTNIDSKPETDEKDIDDEQNNDNNSDEKSITLVVRVPEWDTLTSYDETIYDEDSWIRIWVGKVADEKMVEYNVDWSITHDTSSDTLGDVMDEINSESEFDKFSFNLDKETVGDYGRFVTGVAKNSWDGSDDLFQNKFWGSLQEDIDGKFTNTYDYHYISFSSPNNRYAKEDSHKYFDLNESWLAYDGRISFGADSCDIYNDDIIWLNYWKMV